MKGWKRLIYYLLINVVVSACTVLAVLTIWERTRAPATGLALPIASRDSESDVLETDVTATPGTSVPVFLTPTRTPTAEPTRPVVIITVAANQTLGEIASEYDVDLDELVEFNQLPNPDQISVGMQIFIPVTPQALPTNTPAPTNTPGEAVGSTPSTPVGEAKPIISSVIGAGDIGSERVFITRTGGGDLSLAGWQLRDQDGNVFVFPQLSLYQGGAVNVWTGSGSPTVVDLYWGLGQAVWNSGEQVTLVDAEGDERATYTVP